MVLLWGQRSVGFETAPLTVARGVTFAQGLLLVNHGQTGFVLVRRLETGHLIQSEAVLAWLLVCIGRAVVIQGHIMVLTRLLKHLLTILHERRLVIPIRRPLLENVFKVLVYVLLPLRTDHLVNLLWRAGRVLKDTFFRVNHLLILVPKRRVLIFSVKLGSQIVGWWSTHKGALVLIRCQRLLEEKVRNWSHLRLLRLILHGFARNKLLLKVMLLHGHKSLGDLARNCLPYANSLHLFGVNLVLNAYIFLLENLESSAILIVTVVNFGETSGQNVLFNQLSFVGAVVVIQIEVLDHYL